MATDRDYFLGTHDEELQRLGLQHRVWRAAVLDCWQRAGIAAGSRVLDVGAGPGYAAADLAEIVGTGGEVVAVERSARYVEAGRGMLAQHGFANVRYHEARPDDRPVAGRRLRRRLVPLGRLLRLFAGAAAGQDRRGVASRAASRSSMST